MMLYLHIPFCKRKCRYCAFCSVTEDRYAAYAEKAAADIAYFRAAGLLETADSIYIGGGTPGALPLSAWQTLWGALDGVPLAGGAEFTVETNPESTTAEFLAMLKAHRVERLSVGVQSLNDRELAAIGRLHDGAAALRAIEAAKQRGFSEISADLIYGLPGQTLSSFTDSLTRLLDAGVTHLSCYNLQIEKGTPFYDDPPALPDEDEEQAMYDALCDITRARGFEHYEISNFAPSGHRARHNSGYWERREYLGIGPSAHSFFDGTRRWQSADIPVWLGAPVGSFAGTETLTPEDERTERIMLGLRTDRGVPAKELSAAVVQKYVAAGLGEIRAGRFVLNDRGMLFSNTVISDLI